MLVHFGKYSDICTRATNKREFEMQYNFDEIVDRKGTSAYKIDLCKTRFGTDDLLPLWVADMDFRTPDFIMDAIRKRTEHEVLGYTIRNQDFFDPLIDWLKIRHNWNVDSKWIGYIPGIVPGIAFAINAFTNPGDKVVIQPPIYPPFMNTVINNHRELVYNPLVLRGGQYQMDFEALESSIDERTKMLLLCSPHNPGGRVWNKDELTRLAGICNRNNIIVVSDEIHADLVLPGYEHCPFPTISNEAFNNSITLIAPSKTFNIAGLVSSSYIIPNSILRNKYKSYIEALEVSGGNIFAYTATVAAYKHGAEWLDQLIRYIQGNVDYIQDFLSNNLPKIKAIIPQASFLIWLDFRGLGLSDEEIRNLLIHEAKLGFNDGPSFGPGGEGFQRINVGCSRIVLKEAMDRLANTFKKY
jgi:cysteine-S-conjugate beta-lyase